jgi:hypothetical protein
MIPCFGTLSGSFISNTALLYLAVKTNWIGAYAMLLALILQVFYHCIMGFIFEYQVRFLN